MKADMKKTRIPAIAVMSLILLSAACNKKNEDDVIRMQAHTLFEKSVTAVNKYTDSILSAKDSARVIWLDKNYDRQITNINFQFPPETFTKITEDENDSLVKLTMRYTVARDSMLIKLSASYRAAADSTSTDSTKTTPHPKPQKR